MGLENRTSGNFISIIEGKLCQKVDKNTPGAKERVNKIGNTVWEKYYDKFTGKLVGIKTQEGGAYGKNWVFSFRDNKEVYHLQLSYSNSFATAFLKMLPNVDLNKEMTVSPSVKVGEDGKNKSSLFINQNGVAIKHAYTKDVPNGLPQMIQVQIKGQMVWDDTERLIFLENMVNEKIVPHLEGVATQENVAPEFAGKVEVSSGFDDLVNAMKTTDEEDAF